MAFYNFCKCVIVNENQQLISGLRLMCANLLCQAVSSLQTNKILQNSAVKI